MICDSSCRINHWIEKQIQQFIVPKKQIKVSPRILASNDAVLVGSLAGLMVVNGKPTTYKFFSAEGVETKKVPIKQFDRTLDENLEKRFLRPVSDRYVTFSDFDIFEYEMEDDGILHDISIEGLGWFSFEGRGQVVRVLLPKGAALKESLSKIRPLKPIRKPKKD